MLTSSMDRDMATYPHTMGDEFDRRETATTSSIMDQRATIRMGLKNISFEFTGFNELYSMLLALCNDFMLPETLESILGDETQFYNPQRKDKFKPVTQALESEHTKQFKIRTWQQIASIVGPLSQTNPKGYMVMNYVIGQILEALGGEFKHFKKFMFEEDQNAIMLYQIITGGKMQPPQPMAPAPGQQTAGMPTQNQQGLPQTMQEQQARQSF
jgi:hypothetical protein